MVGNFSSVLVIAPHTDDGELGAGGTIAKLVEKGAKVSYVAFSAAEESVPNGLPRNILRTEVLSATAELGIPSDDVQVFDYKVRYFPERRQSVLEDLVKLRSAKAYDLVLMPSLDDIHQDHRTIAEETLRAFKGTTILCYELVWNNFEFPTCAFVKLEPHHLGAKIRAMARYKSQSGRPYSSEDFIRSLARVRGVQIGAEFAECFEVARLIID